MKQSLFEFVIIVHPTKAEAEKGEKSKILIERTTILANDINSANIIAARAIPEGNLNNLENIVIAMRPF